MIINKRDRMMTVREAFSEACKKTCYSFHGSPYSTTISVATEEGRFYGTVTTWPGVFTNKLVIEFDAVKKSPPCTLWAIMRNTEKLVREYSGEDIELVVNITVISKGARNDYP